MQTVFYLLVLYTLYHQMRQSRFRCLGALPVEVYVSFFFEVNMKLCSSISVSVSSSRTYLMWSGALVVRYTTTRTPIGADVVNTGNKCDNVAIRFRTDNPGPWFLH
ncbi:hypothetical protein F5146DRAFT_373700 [Armillaria mellea]|nr:hypothetical protein F5146DRAFT_373700 [Armillaria mellea]